MLVRTAADPRGPPKRTPNEDRRGNRAAPAERRPDRVGAVLRLGKTRRVVDVVVRERLGQWQRVEFERGEHGNSLDLKSRPMGADETWGAPTSRVG